MTFPRVLKLKAWSPVIEGDGSELKLELEAYKESPVRGRATWRGKVRIEVDRYFVRQIALAIEQMQKRDRERLTRERARLDYELEPVQIKQPKEPT